MAPTIGQILNHPTTLRIAAETEAERFKGILSGSKRCRPCAKRGHTTYLDAGQTCGLCEMYEAGQEAAKDVAYDAVDMIEAAHAATDPEQVPQAEPPTIRIGDHDFSADIPPFDAILEEIRAMHDKKSKDYGTDEDPLANIRASERFGIPAWLGATVRGHDKVVRIQAFAKKGTLANESVEDSLLDLCVYSIIALQLYRESNHKTGCSCHACRNPADRSNLP